MDSSVLQKTVASLETALRYNPNNIELMTSLAEGYIRMGRLDQETIDLCEKVLQRNPDNSLINQAQAVAYVIDQTDRIVAGLKEGREPPEPDAIHSSIAILDEFLQEVSEVPMIWYTWTRLSQLAGFLEQGNRGIRHLQKLHFEDLSGLRPTLDWISKHPSFGRFSWKLLFEAYEAIGDRETGIARLEEGFDNGRSQGELGPLLLEHYNAQYSPAHADEVPEPLRPRLFQILLDYGDPDLTAQWLRKASLYGWEINNYSKVYVKDLIDQGELETAFEILQRMSMDQEVRDWLNRIADIYEERDEDDEAVKVLRFINENILLEGRIGDRTETEMTREMELSMAELNVKNGRLNDALIKYTAALCLGDEPDESIIERIDELLSTSTEFDTLVLLRLSSYFRRQQDMSKTVFYLNRLIKQDADNPEALKELQSLFDDILTRDPDNPGLRLELGRLYVQTGRHEDAIRELEIAVQNTTLNDTAGRLLAKAYFKNGQREEALNRYQDLMLEETDLETLYQLHLEFARIDDARSALTALDLISRVDGRYRDVESRRKELHTRTGSIQAGSPGEVKMRELIGELAIGRYRHIEKVGSGGMGVVHKVEDLRTGHTVAMKILRDGLGGSSKALDRFFREARIAASLKDPHIVQIFDYNISSENGQSYICMEFVDGPSLREIVDQHFEDTISTNRDFVTEMLYYSIQVFGALEPTHKKGIIHRDIKPDNIMITSRGEVKITDFGIVHVEEATFTPTGAMLGTPRYMSPEQVSGAKIDGRSDIYSVGILMYEILTGSPPFITGDISYQQVNKDPVPPRAVNSVIPEDVNGFILKCLAKLPEQRFDTATEAKELLIKILNDLGGCKKYQSSTVLGTRAELTPGEDPDQTPVDEADQSELDGDMDLDLPEEDEDEDRIEAPAGATPAPQTGFDPDLDLD